MPIVLFALLVQAPVDGGVEAPQFVGTGNFHAPPGVYVDGGPSSGSVRGVFECTGVENGGPCVKSTNSILEMYGAYPTHLNNDGNMLVCNIELYAIPPRQSGCVMGIGNTVSANKIWTIDERGNVRQRDLYISTEDNEARIHGVSAYGSGGTARLSVRGQVPASTGGPSVYVHNAVTQTAGDTFSVLNGYQSTGVHVSYQGVVGLGKVYTQYLPPCNSNYKGRTAYDATKDCFVGCTGTAWKCFLLEP